MHMFKKVHNKNKLLLFLFIFIIALVNGCLVRKDLVLARNCNALDGTDKLDCYYEKALYHTFDGEYNAAFQQCQQISAGFGGGLTSIKQVFSGVDEAYYNKCVTNIAVVSLNDSWCSQTKSGTITGIFTSIIDLHKEECLSAVREEIRKRSGMASMSNMWECILNPYSRSC